MNYLDLLNDAQVYQQLLRWLQGKLRTALPHTVST